MAATEIAAGAALKCELRTPTRASARFTKGFTLIELLICVALGVTLYVLYLSGGSKRFQTKQKQACQKNLQNTYIALKTYSVENLGSFPAFPDATTSELPLSLLVPRCTTVTEMFVCPGTGDKPPPAAEGFAQERISYAYYSGRSASQGPSAPLMTDEQVNTQAKHLGAPLFSADGEALGNNHHRYGGVILFCDGSTQIAGTNAPLEMSLGPGEQLLNPKP